MSDPYNPYEKALCLTRHSLELLDAFQFGAAIATKSDLIVRDVDILQEIASHSPVLCKLTVTTASDVLSQKLEPGAPPSSRRLAAIATLVEKGLFAGILLMPVLPFLEDSAENVLEIVRLAGECGARFIYPAFGMTMRPGQREWYLSKLEILFPGQELSKRYMQRYGSRYQCSSPQPSCGSSFRRPVTVGEFYTICRKSSAPTRRDIPHSSSLFSSKFRGNVVDSFPGAT